MVCAETEHVSIRLLAGPMLTIGPKRNSEALIRGFRSVAQAALSSTLPLFARTSSRAGVAALGVMRQRRRTPW
jgi:hypothetical protein